MASVADSTFAQLAGFEPNCTSVADIRAAAKANMHAMVNLNLPPLSKLTLARRLVDDARMQEQRGDMQLALWRYYQSASLYVSVLEDIEGQQDKKRKLHDEVSAFKPTWGRMLASVNKIELGLCEIERKQHPDDNESACSCNICVRRKILGPPIIPIHALIFQDDEESVHLPPPSSLSSASRLDISEADALLIDCQRLLQPTPSSTSTDIDDTRRRIWCTSLLAAEAAIARRQRHPPTPPQTPPTPDPPNSPLSLNRFHDRDSVISLIYLFEPILEEAAPGRISAGTSLTSIPQMSLEFQYRPPTPPRKSSREASERAPDVATFDSASVFAPSSVDQATFHCQICLEQEPVDQGTFIDPCRHHFGNACLRAYIASRLEEGRFPVPCPGCQANSDQRSPALVSTAIASRLLSDPEATRWNDMELAQAVIRFTCPKCTQIVSIDRNGSRKKGKKILCPTQGCDHIWCRECQGAIRKGTKHRCEGKDALSKLMRRQGWRSCPGCDIPIYKVDGCNHVHCTAPGCNTHFCYRCGKILIRSVFSTDVYNATRSHFRRKLYFWRCSQFHDPNVVVRLLTGRWGSL